MRADSRPGRPSRLTPERADAIIDAMREGATVKAAAEAAGVGRRTVYDWLERGREQPHGQLVARVEAVLDERKQPSWEETLAQLDSEYEHWRPAPIREVLRAVDEFELLADLDS